MALSDSIEFGAITIRANGIMEVRVDRVIYDGTTEVARRYNRTVYTPDMDPATLPAKVRRIANVVWDSATVSAYQAQKTQ